VSPEELLGYRYRRRGGLEDGAKERGGASKTGFITWIAASKARRGHEKAQFPAPASR
jgi:hypothetical protein